MEWLFKCLSTNHDALEIIIQGAAVIVAIIAAATYWAQNKVNEGTRYGAFTIFVSANQHVSMNMFGLPVSFLDELETQDKWFGVTYKEDKPAVVAACSEESRLFL